MQRLTVDVFTTDGVRVSGSLYLVAASYTRGRPEEVADLLNDDRTFVPFAGHDPAERPGVLHKGHIVRVHTAAPAAADPQDAPPSPRSDGAEACTLLLDDGTWLEGRLCVDTPLASSRLVDKLNLASRFVPVLADDGIVFVNRDHVIRVW
jgi:hypothetical protein